MKIKQLVIVNALMLCMITQTSYAQKIQTMLQLENLKEKVKSIHITNESGSHLKVWFDKTRKEESWENKIVWDNYVYDKENRLISLIEYYK